MQKRFLLFICAIFFLAGCTKKGPAPEDTLAQTTPGPTPMLVTAQSGSYQLTVQNVGAAGPTRASFVIFTKGTKRDFSDPRYQYQSEDVFMTMESATEVMVQKPGTTWQGFFDTLPMKLSSDCLVTGTGQEFCNGDSGQLRFYLNGKKQADVLQQPIQSGDRLLITFGGESELELRKQMDQVPFVE